jgi:hypothetical protein
MRWVLIVVGAVLDLMGTVWLLQGLNLLPGTFMRGSMLWVGIGLVMDVVGVGLIVYGARRRPSGP